ncbi:hypothetical protein [Paludisphaera mucosa]|uniref:Lipoprotein n=1 Tax=Paludisphaera mucosa TaxID=3030827 RepID=A0ABT6FB38_9BACT|nr:hypothetical protein [Paludisphaera mucosa]MDG3004800.1 hypothetical protein [Paludisphaera mucosa]
MDDRSRFHRVIPLLAATALVAVAPLVVGCDGGAPAAPVPTEAEIQKRQDDEIAARQKAYGKAGIPIGRHPEKAAKKG